MLEKLQEQDPGSWFTTGTCRMIPWWGGGGSRVFFQEKAELLVRLWCLLVTVDMQWTGQVSKNQVLWSHALGTEAGTLPCGHEDPLRLFSRECQIRVALQQHPALQQPSVGTLVGQTVAWESLQEKIHSRTKAETMRSEQRQEMRVCGAEVA